MTKLRLWKLWQPFWITALEWFAYITVASIVLPPVHGDLIYSFVRTTPGALLVTYSMWLWTRAHGSQDEHSERKHQG